MKIWIDRSTLKPSESSYILPKYGIATLLRLSDYGHQIALRKDALNDLQSILIRQEGIDLANFSEQDADAVIRREKSGGFVYDYEDKHRQTFESLREVADFITRNHRFSEIKRTTSETDISVQLNIDGSGESGIKTGLGFFDHMLDQIAKHGFFDLNLTCDGDLHVDEHHTIEDTALALGEAFVKALGNKRGIGRYGFVVPMDETEATVSIDLSGRPYLVFDAEFQREYVGDFPTEMARHFFHSLAMSMKATLHMKVYGDNDHHKIEGLFKALARVLRQACDRNEQYMNILPSSKGSL